MMEVPQLHGFGPAANRLLEAYNTLQKVRAYTGTSTGHNWIDHQFCMVLI